MTYIEFEMDVDTWVTHEGDPNDEWDRDSTDGSVSARSAKLVKKDGYHVLGSEHDFKVGDVCYLVWAQYSTGDSFGRDGGQYELLEVCADREDAELRKKHYESIPGDDYSVPWSGYFECLDFVSVDGLVVT